MGGKPQARVELATQVPLQVLQLLVDIVAVEEPLVTPRQLEAQVFVEAEVQAVLLQQEPLLEATVAAD